MSNDNSAGEKGLLSGWWGALCKPSSRWSLGGLLASGIVLGVVLWGGFNWALEATNTETFCLSCHEMEQNVYREFRGTIHDSNRSGVRATCPDCHVPRPWVYKMIRKIQASNEIWHKILGSIDTREKFEAKRIELATHVWTAMKATDSRECRNCHDFGAFDLTRQTSRARNRHAEAEQQGKTCIDCHKGVAHQLPAGAFKAERELNKSMEGETKP
ncbi:NapC/NirT family cytochrome c [Magnetospirillum sp. SS-4]|uniref:NapC/NirT family cytochrome c n=1 Tax=Magnetospirillum sp. SS-4 TaxID=2681465 RepID=UPI001384772F|nr:NapC/NirT family cytochrome c [Magnetospirillum sp. SS-4]CAA7621693.1 nitrate reductase, cytochrome c-type,periplasmic [Magnetospirillum sp. SS-4]